MNKQKHFNKQAIQHQRGAVAIIVALCLTLLIGMLGLVLDLGHLYVAKTELQNAADAAALAGAKELTGTLAGVVKAKSAACELGGYNKYDLNSTKVANSSGTPSSCTNITISVGSDPDTMVGIDTITSNTLASNKSFLKVETGPRQLDTWFAKIWAVLKIQTFGMAVAGKYTYDIAPLGICSMQPDLTDSTMVKAPDGGDLGYKRGVTYRLSDANPIGPGTMYWINPVTVTDTAESSPCPNGTNSDTDSLPYVCTGRVNFTPQVGQYVYTNSGISTPQLDALDSRFNIYPNDAKCDPVTAPPDRNIMSYAYNGSGGQPKDWMVTNPASTPLLPTQQSITFGYYSCDLSANTCTDQCKGKVCSKNDVGQTGNVIVAWRPKPYLLESGSANPTKDTDYGVLWSASRPVGKTVIDWPNLYKTKPKAIASYPDTSPYTQTSPSPYYQVVTGVNTAKPDRRMMNIVILDCHASGGSCRPAKVLGIGQFLLQRQVGVDNNVYLEYAGLLSSPLPSSDIRLYR